ncbi:hypothetical protein ACU8KH_05473 [Lachancea thermotolerans]
MSLFSAQVAFTIKFIEAGFNSRITIITPLNNFGHVLISAEEIKRACT